MLQIQAVKEIPKRNGMVDADPLSEFLYLRIRLRLFLDLRPLYPLLGLIKGP
jgi:hypothetical protein